MDTSHWEHRLLISGYLAPHSCLIDLPKNHESYLVIHLLNNLSELPAAYRIKADGCIHQAMLFTTWLPLTEYPLTSSPLDPLSKGSGRLGKTQTFSLPVP